MDHLVLCSFPLFPLCFCWPSTSLKSFLRQPKKLFKLEGQQKQRRKRERRKDQMMHHALFKLYYIFFFKIPQINKLI